MKPINRGFLDLYSLANGIQKQQFSSTYIGINDQESINTFPPMLKIIGAIARYGKPGTPVLMALDTNCSPNASSVLNLMDAF